jgi:hypothetical protein
VPEEIPAEYGAVVGGCLVMDGADRLTAMLTRLKLTAIRDQLDGLLDEAGRGELTPHEGLALLGEREIARKDSPSLQTLGPAIGCR